jgi:hypothetical protein
LEADRKILLLLLLVLLLDFGFLSIFGFRPSNSLHAMTEKHSALGDGAGGGVPNVTNL